jgi:3-dehydroquinate synthase
MAIDAFQAPVFYSEKAYENLNRFLKETEFSSVFIFVDTNTQNLCLPSFLQKLETSLTIEVIEMEPGEENKHIETCSGVWNVLSELGADRKSLIINLGGGVVTDLGGFVASTFKRGIAYINVPTTLLSMVDASVGGKTGVDLGNLKNQVGVITEPEMVVIDTAFLETLAAAEMRSGLAEIFKHGLISNRAYWNKATNLKELTLDDLDGLIAESVHIKKQIVQQDPRENGLRKTLNFGHTFGHAIESYFLTHPHKAKLLHGEAVAAGMIIASYLSNKLTKLPDPEFEEIKEKLLEVYPPIELEVEDFEGIIDLLKFDKKNSHGKINFVLLRKIGEPVFDCSVPMELLQESLQLYKNLKS